MEPPTIHSDRLDLILLTPAFLEACLAGDVHSAEAIIGVSIPPEWLEEADLMRLRLDQVLANPDYGPWMLRAIGLRATGQMIGHIGFHTAPDPDYLRTIAPDAVEFGYTIFPAFRRNRYAQEAAVALMTWAYQTHAVTRFVTSVSPHNIPSLGLINNLGFRQIASQIDDEDGPEDVFLLEFAPSAPHTPTA